MKYILNPIVARLSKKYYFQATYDKAIILDKSVIAPIDQALSRKYSLSLTDLIKIVSKRKNDVKGKQLIKQLIEWQILISEKTDLKSFIAELLEKHIETSYWGKTNPIYKIC